MCGIFGVVNYEIETEKIIYCLNLIKHRGPDGQGIYRDNGVVLGHRRLSILDTTNHGKQPMSYQNGRYVITYNGEIYNFLEIRNELKKKGYVFTSETDTEVILASYIEWQEECLTHFNGMWAFAIWDNEKKILFIARDRFGVKPFYYTLLGAGEAIGFASEMKALMPILPNRSIQEDLIMRAGIFGYESTEECLVSGIKRLPAGHCAIFKDGQLKVRRWWNTLDHLPEVPHSYEEQVEMFRQVFVDACKIRMRSDVTIGTALSGGLDSSATICTMAHIADEGYGERVNRDWQHAFVATFPETTLNEAYYAKKVTDYLNIEKTEIDMRTKCSPQTLEEDLFLFEEIYLTTPIPMIATYKAIRENGVTVTIDGHGADELFCGYAFDFFEGFPDAKFQINRIEEIMKIYWETYPHDSSNLAIEGKDKDYAKYYKYMLGYYKKQLIQLIKSEKNENERHANWKKLDHLSKVLYQRTHNNILPTLLRNYDRYSMAGSVEIRMPFLDYRIVTMASALPNTTKLRNGYSKAIIRDALSEYMPKEIAYRKTKIGFNTPIVEWMQGDLREYFEDTISSVDFYNSSMINSKKVRDEVLKVIKGGESVTFSQAEQAYKHLAPYLWEKCFYKRRWDISR